MLPFGMTRPSRSFTSTVVDIFIRPSTVIEGNELPGIVELQAYLRSLDSVVLVYHRKRDKKTAKFDHIYVAFRTSGDADNFFRMWLFWDDGHFMKRSYKLRRRSDLPSV
ncbi:hypothetical protein RSAG8_03402, partial [Rhizoctonia solani AG-8 WAC10335]